MTTPLAEFNDVTKTYQTPFRPGRAVDALRGVSLAVESGEIFALLGPNRAGKTTLLKILLGLCRPGGGKVRRMGLPLSERRTLKSIGYMHENQAFPRYLTAAELLDYYGRFTAVPAVVLRDRIPRLLERMGLTDRAREPISRFSKGMVQRLALAQSLLNDPELLVLDEPMEGLDMSARLLLQEILRERKEAGKSVLVVSHSLGEVAEVCDRLAVIADGRIGYLGSLKALLQDPATGLVRKLSEALSPIYRDGLKDACHDRQAP